MNAKRLIYNALCDNLDRPEITILLGARQVGKTHLLKEVAAFAKKKGKSTKYFNLELPADMLKFSSNEHEIFELLTTSADVILIDEFHYLKNISHLFKAVYDSNSKVKIFASGSSALEIHKHLKESLAGRRRVYRIFPLSILEYKNNGLSLEKTLIEGTLFLENKTEAGG